jgi:tetratricopeptide (TPR) repeat protein
MVAAFPLLAFLLATAPGLPQKSFEQIARQADEARTADRVNDAVVLYSQAVRLRPTWSEGWWWIGSLFYEQDRFPEAKNAFKRFVTIAAKPEPAYAFLALCEYETHDYDPALHHFQAWASKGWPGTTELIDVAVFHFALLLTQKGRFVAALYLLATEAGKLGDSPALVEAMGLASLHMANLPEDYPASRREMVWLAGKAALYASLRARGNGRADEYAGRLLAHYSHEPNVHYFRATLFGFQKEWAAAAEEYQQELQISPHYAGAMVELAFAHIYNFQPAKAVPLAERAVALEPNDPRAHHALGRALLEIQRFSESARELELAKQLAPDNAIVRFHLAKAYQKLGRKKDAEHERAAFDVLKDKEEVLAPPSEKIAIRRQLGRPR